MPVSTRGGAWPPCPRLIDLYPTLVIVGTTDQIIVQGQRSGQVVNGEGNDEGYIPNPSAYLVALQKRPLPDSDLTERDFPVDRHLGLVHQLISVQTGRHGIGSADAAIALSSCFFGPRLAISCSSEYE